MTLRHLGKRLDALTRSNEGCLVVWTTSDDECLVGADGARCHRTELPEDGSLHVIVRRFTTITRLR